ncbi:MAG TPA: putative sulfate exporter family transporter [Tepidisphaeraceae bacterium]|jgi:uncharacterized integral membrane protein (TIGR00698 family)
MDQVSTLDEVAIRTPSERDLAKLVKQVLFVIVGVVCLKCWISAGTALAIGVALALSIGNPFAKSGKFAKLLLQASVVLLGFTMDLRSLLTAGASGAIFALITISTTLALGWYLGKLLKTGRLTSLLISTGTAICGGSAIAAVGSVVGAPDSEMTVAIGTVFTLNAIALFIFPDIGHALHLTQHQFGIWSGVAIHDISSVVGAASMYGVISLQTATAVKLSRTLWIVPVALAAAALEQRRHAANKADGESQAKAGKKKLQIPWFIALFVLASVSRSFIPAVAESSKPLEFAAKAGMTLTLFLIGAGLSMKTLRSVGWRALVQGVAIWVFISVGSLLAIMHMH